MNLKFPRVAVLRLQFEENDDHELFELQIEPRAFLSSRSFSSPEPMICSQCGREGRRVEKIVVDRSSIPADLDMFRITNFPTKILVTERFREAVSKLNLTNILFSNVELAYY